MIKFKLYFLITLSVINVVESNGDIPFLMMIRQHLNDFQIYLWPEELCFDNGAVRMKICILRYPHSARIFRFSMNPVWFLLFKAVTC